MRFIGISDTHGCHRQLELPEGEVLLHAGDVCDKGNANHIEDFLEWFGELDYKYKILVRGNHDYDLVTGNSLLDRKMPDGVIQLEHSGIEVEGISIWGVPFDYYKKNKNWNAIPHHTQILISHQPPYSILDLTPNKISRGEKDLLRKVKEVQPDIHLFGHIHASYGQQKIEDTLFFNASGYKASEERLVNAPFIFDI